jgi:hypothetical protein
LLSLSLFLGAHRVWRTAAPANLIPGAWLPCPATGSKRQCGCQHPHGKGHGGTRQPGRTGALLGGGLSLDAGWEEKVRRGGE